MYAEERQQAMAQLVTERGRLSVDEHRRASTTSPPRPCAATSPPSSGSAWSAACTAARCPPRALAVDRGRARRARPGQHRPEGPDRHAPPSALLPPDGSTVLLDAGSTTSRLASLLPRDLRLVVFTHAVPVAARLAGCPQVELHLLPGRVRTDHPGRGRRRHRRARSAGCAPTSRSSAPTALSTRPRALHPRPRGGRDQARDGRRRPPRRRARRLQQDRRRVADPLRRRSTEVDVLVTDDGIARRRPTSARAGRRRGRGAR